MPVVLIRCAARLGFVVFMFILSALFITNGVICVRLILLLLLWAQLRALVLRIMGITDRNIFHH